MSRVFDASQTGANETSLLTPPNAVYNNLNAWTLAAWVYPTASDPFGVIFVKDPQVSYDIFFVIPSLVLSIQAAYSITAANSLSTTTVPTNQWSHIAATFNKSGDAKIRMYLNGVEVSYFAQQAGSGTLPDDSANGWMSGNDTFDDGFTGRIAEQAIWNTDLTAVQITTLAASTTGASAIAAGNLVGYWHLCGTASPEPDATVNGDNAVLSTNPPTKGVDSPGFTCSGGGTVPWSSTDSRVTPNASRTVNQTKIYDVQTSLNPSVPGTDSRTAGAPVASGTYPQNSRTPGTFGPGE